MKNLRSHKHRCSNGHVWEHEAQVARMLDKELNKLDHTCGVCGEVQYVRVIEEERTKARVQHLAIEMLASAFEKMPDAGPGELLAAFGMLQLFVVDAAAKAQRAFKAAETETSDAKPQPPQNPLTTSQLYDLWRAAFPSSMPNPFATKEGSS